MTVMRMLRSDCDVPASQNVFFHVMTVVFPYSVFCFAVFHCQNFLLLRCKICNTVCFYVSRVSNTVLHSLYENRTWIFTGIQKKIISFATK